MHAKALKLLQQYVSKPSSSIYRRIFTNYVLNRLSEREDEMGDKLGPSISYLQKLGPEYMDQIFESARWVFDQDRDVAFQVGRHTALFLSDFKIHDTCFILDLYLR
jgi:hypothetical protein